MKKRFLAFIFLGVASCAAKIGNEDNKIYPHRGVELDHKHRPLCHGTVDKSIVVGARHLKEGGSYVFEKANTRLIIDGSLPKDVKLDVIGGPLQVNGNIGENVSIHIETSRACANEFFTVHGKKGKGVWVEKKFR